MKFFGKILPALLLALIILPGCAVRKDITQIADKVASDMEKRQAYRAGLKPFEEVNAPYISGYTQSMSSGHAYLKGKKITIREQGAYLADLGDKIASATGTVVRYSPDLAKRRDVVNTTMNVRFSGDLKELLDKIAGYYNIHWEYQKDTGTIVFYYMKTKTYTIPAHLSDLSVETELTNKSSSTSDSSGATIGGASGESEQTVETKADYKAWDEFLRNIQAMISKDGSVVVSRGAGTITVTESPLVLKEIDDYIQGIANKLSRQVSINVRVYNYRTQDEVDFGASIKGAFNDGYTSLAFGNPIAMSGGGFTATVLENTNIFNKNWAGSEGFLSALKTKGRMSLQTTASGITQNNQPMPVQALRRTGYLASMSTTLNGDNSETSLVPGQVVSGMSILITPHIQPDDIINLEYNMSYSVLDSIDEVSTPDGRAMIQTPTVSSRSIMQRFQIRTNSTIIIAGYASDLKGDDSGIHILGLNINTKDDKEYVIIIIDVNDATLPTYNTGKE